MFEVDFNDIMLELEPLAEAKAKLEAIVRYVQSCKYSPDKEIIFAIAGYETETKESEGE